MTYRPWRYALALLLVVSSAAFAVQSTTIILVPHPGYPQSVGSGSLTSLRWEDLFCYDFIPPVGITSATNVYWRGGAGGTDVSGIAIYNADGTEQLMVDSVTGGTVDTENTATVTSFTLWAGTEYRLCWCTDEANMSYRISASSKTEMSDFMRGMGTQYGVIEGVCTTGIPPATASSTLADPGTAHMPPLVTLGTANMD